jgi:hypothetical protein
VDRGSPILNTYHSLFKFANPSEDEDGPGENGGVFGYFGDRADDGEEPQLFKPAQENCYKWKKVKVSDDKAAFATFYSDKANRNKWWTPTATAEHPLVECHLLLTRGAGFNMSVNPCSFWHHTTGLSLCRFLSHCIQSR